jgi:hypothetical protein
MKITFEVRPHVVMESQDIVEIKRGGRLIGVLYAQDTRNGMVQVKVLSKFMTRSWAITMPQSPRPDDEDIPGMIGLLDIGEGDKT